MPKDIRKLDAITRFFGGCVQNVEDLTKKLTTTLTVQLETPECVEYLSQSQGFFEEMLQSWSGLGKPLSQLDETLGL